MGKILLGGHEEQVLVEVKAGAAITPGDLIAYSAAGSPPAATRHATAGGGAQPMFALDSVEQNLGIDDNYATNDRLQAVIARPGTLMRGRVAAGAPAIVFGDLLESAGDGTLRKVLAGARATLAVGTGNAGVTFEAASPGNEGNEITIEVVAATAATATVTVTGKAISIKPNSTTPGTTDTAASVVTLVNGSAEASALVVARATGTGASAIVSPVAATALSGGRDAGGNPEAVIGRAMEAVDNSGEGTAARIKLEVAG